MPVPDRPDPIDAPDFTEPYTDDPAPMGEEGGDEDGGGEIEDGGGEK